MTNTSKQIIFLIVALIIGGILGFFLGKSGLSGQKASLVSTTPTPVQSNQLFRSQTATFQGEITKVNKGSLEVKSNTGQMGSVSISDRVVIYKFKEGSKQATASSDINSIETNKKVLIILELSGDQYKVVSISYQPSAVLTKVTPTPIQSRPTALPLKKK